MRAAHAGNAGQAIRQSILADIVFGQRSGSELNAIDSQSTVRGRDPNAASVVFAEAENLGLQGRGQARGDAYGARLNEGDSMGSANPKHSGGVLEEAAHVVR